MDRHIVIRTDISQALGEVLTDYLEGSMGL